MLPGSLHHFLGWPRLPSRLHRRGASDGGKLRRSTTETSPLRKPVRMDIVKICPPASAMATNLILSFCAVIAVLLVWRMFRKPDVPSWGRRGRRT
jgi:hypothetical protein